MSPFAIESRWLGQKPDSPQAHQLKALRADRYGGGLSARFVFQAWPTVARTFDETET
jgi:hypothetical protein